MEVGSHGIDSLNAKREPDRVAMNFNPEIQHYLAQSGNLVTTTDPIDATGPRSSVDDVTIASVGVTEPIPTTDLSAGGFSFPSVTDDLNLSPQESQCPALSSAKAYPFAHTIPETCEDVQTFETLEEGRAADLATPDFQPAVAEETPEEPFDDMVLLEGGMVTVATIAAENIAPVEKGVGVDCGYADPITYTHNAEETQLPDAPIQELENAPVEGPFNSEVPVQFPKGHELLTEDISGAQEIPDTDGRPTEAFPETDEASESVTSLNWQSSPVVPCETSLEELPSKQLLVGSEEGGLETEPLINEGQGEEVSGDVKAPKVETLISIDEQLVEDTGDVEVSELETGTVIGEQPNEDTGNVDVPELETGPLTGKQSGEDSSDEKVPKLETLPLIGEQLGKDTADVEGPKLETRLQGIGTAKKLPQFTMSEQVQLSAFHSGKPPEDMGAEHTQNSAIYSEKFPEGTEAKQTQLIEEDGAKPGILEKDAEELKGRKLLKKFGKKIFTGNIVGYDPNTRWFKVVYEDGDEEELEWAEIEPILVAPVAMTEPLSKKRYHSRDEDEQDQRPPKKAKKSVAPTPPRKRKSPGPKKKKTSTSGKKGKGSKSPGISAKSSGSKGKALKTKQEDSKKLKLKKKTSSGKKLEKTKGQEQLQAGSSKKSPGKKTELRAKSAETGSQRSKSPLKVQDKVSLKGNQRKQLASPKSAIVSKTRTGMQKLSSPKPQTTETQKGKGKKSVWKQVGSAKSVEKQKSVKKGTQKSKQQLDITSPNQKGGTKRKADVVTSPKQESGKKRKTDVVASPKQKGGTKRKADIQIDSSQGKHVRWGDTGNTGGGKTLRSKGAAAVKVEEENTPSVQKSSALEQGVLLVGRMIRKKFGGKFYSGEVSDFDKKTKYYKVVYEDGDEEEVEWSDLEKMLILENNTDASSSKISGRKNIPGRPASQKKSPRGKKRAGKGRF